MNKAILSISGVLFFLACGIISFLSFEAIGADLACILAMLFGFGSICFIVYGIEDTKVGDYMANFFAGEEDDDE